MTTLLLVLMAAGCETTDSSLQAAGKTEAYITGFHDGRHSGMKEAGNYLEHMVKDTQRFETETDYREGWLAGEEEGIRMQQQADAAVGSAAGYQITKDANKSVKRDIEKAGKEATQNIDTDSLKNLK
ncbi:hypothetical protein FV139_17565 [Parahaliea maris]|uniref:Lipoprotein n=1 Tax=Parahaliea maris TaxID=2716870 RepID=A0A5C8ZSN8_9GAMM|nr:hypothetical protein [Parahaliea maris]TXS90784.1 hypothetical protein FV139_17565 [Parahaliea maris]